MKRGRPELYTALYAEFDALGQYDTMIVSGRDKHELNVIASCFRNRYGGGVIAYRIMSDVQMLITRIGYPLHIGG